MKFKSISFYSSTFQTGSARALQLVGAAAKSAVMTTAIAVGLLSVSTGAPAQFGLRSAPPGIRFFRFTAEYTVKATSESASGSLGFTDANKTDHHTVSATFLFSTGDSFPLGSLSTAVLSDSGLTSASGSVGWTYSADNSVLSAMTPGTSVQEVWNVAVNHGHGGNTVKQVTITLVSPADVAPEILSSVTAGSVTEVTHVTGSSTVNHAGAAIMFADGESTDIPTATVLLENAAYKDATGQPVNLDPAKLAVLENALRDTVRPGNSNIGGAYRSYDVADEEIDFLGRGETVMVTATIRLVDGHGHQVDTPVTVTLNGTNDLTTVGEIASQKATPADAPITIDLLSTATDPDHGDVVALASAPTVTSSDGHVVAFSMNGSKFAIDPSQIAYLQSGQGVDLSIGFDVGDDHGMAHATAAVSIAKPGPGDIHLTDWAGASAEQVVFTDTVGTTDHWWQPIGNVIATDGANSGSLSYSLTGPSASDFTLMGAGLYLTGQAHLDYDAWHAVVENAFGGGLTNVQIDAKLGSGIVSDPVAAAALASAFAGTPYMTQISATDAFGSSSTQDVFINLHDIGHDLQNVSVTVDSTWSELTPVGTVVGHIDGLLPSTTSRQTRYFSFDGHNLAVVRPLDFSAQSHFDMQLEMPVASTAVTPFWTYSPSSSLPVDVQGAHLLSGDSSSFNFTQTASEATEGGAQETLIGTTTLPADGTTTFAVNAAYSGQAFEVRPNGEQQFGTLSASVAQDVDASHPQGTIAWSYMADPTKVATLSESETATDNFMVNLADNHGAWWQAAPSLKVTSVNSAPTVSAPAQAASISVDPGHGTGGSETSGDNFQLTNANWHDTHAVSTLLSTDFGDHALGTMAGGIQTDATNGATEAAA